MYLYKDIISPDARTFTVEAHKTTGRNGQEVNAHKSFGVDITSAKLCTDLVNLGIGYNKSYSDLHIPEMPENLVRHFIRGYFDGDGCITIWLSKEKGKSDRVRGKFDICAKSASILNEFIINEIYDKPDENGELKLKYKSLHDLAMFVFNYISSKEKRICFKKVI